MDCETPCIAPNGVLVFGCCVGVDGDKNDVLCAKFLTPFINTVATLGECHVVVVFCDYPLCIVTALFQLLNEGYCYLTVELPLKE